MKRKYKLLILLVVSYLLIECSKQNLDSLLNIESPLGRIQKDTELSINNLGSLKEFSERSPDYNPSWVAKLKLSEQEALKLQDELIKKQYQPFEKRGALSETTPWWAPPKTATRFQYFTWHNAPVVVILSHQEGACEVYIEWSSP